MRHVRFAFLTTVAVAAVVVTARPAQASPIAYEGFRMPFPNPFDGGTGFGGPWVKGGFNAFAAQYAWSEVSCPHSGVFGSGGCVSGEAVSAINGAVRPLLQPLGADNTTVYVSFAVQPRGTLDEGVFNGFFGLTLNGSFFQDLFVGKPGGGATHKYVIESRGGAGQYPSDVTTIVNRVAFMVIRAEFFPGNDTFTLWADPSPRGSEPPPGGIVKQDQDLGTVSAIGIYSTGAFAIDEIRIGTTWADVVPSS